MANKATLATAHERLYVVFRLSPYYQRIFCKVNNYWHNFRNIGMSYKYFRYEAER